MNRHDDVFAGRMDTRLERADQLLRAAALDAQCRDWTAERPDRVAFARLGEAHHSMRAALLRYTRFPPVDDWVPGALSIGTCASTTVLILLLAPAPAAPVTLAAALVAGLVTGQVTLTALFRLRDRRAARATTVPAPIDDPYLYAELTRRIEACAATARSGPEPLRAAAGDLDRALFWIAAAQRI